MTVFLSCFISYIFSSYIVNYLLLRYGHLIFGKRQWFYGEERSFFISMFWLSPISLYATLIFFLFWGIPSLISLHFSSAYEFACKIKQLTDDLLFPIVKNEISSND